MRFEAITPDNEPWVERIFAGEAEQYWVHYNTYWLDMSRRHADIFARLIHVAGRDEPVGFIAYGRHYADERLTRPVDGWQEVIHLVIDKPLQGRGYGRQATVEAIEQLRALPGTRRIVIAYNPANLKARRLYESLGFKELGRNYDDDPLLGLDV